MRLLSMRLLIEFVDMVLCCSSCFGTEQILIQRLHANLGNNIAYHYKWNNRLTKCCTFFAVIKYNNIFTRISTSGAVTAYACGAPSSSHVFVGSVFSSCPITHLHVFSSVLWCPARFPHKTIFGSTAHCHLFYRGFVFYCHFFLLTYIGVQHDFHVKQCSVRLHCHLFYRRFVFYYVISFF